MQPKFKKETAEIDVYPCTDKRQFQ